MQLRKVSPTTRGLSVIAAGTPSFERTKQAPLLLLWILISLFPFSDYVFANYSQSVLQMARCFPALRVNEGVMNYIKTPSLGNLLNVS